MATKKKLYKSRKNKVLAGIIGGLSEYLDVDSTLLRLGWLFIFISTGIFPGLLVYLVAIFIVPKKA